jgi:hypothetical protein
MDTLFDLDPEWKNEWVDMPEFIQEKKEPFCQIIVRFNSLKDLEEFSKKINQPLTKKTKSIWYPQLKRGENSNKRYSNEP